MEIWKTVKGFEQYQVSNLGRVRKGDKPIRLRINSNGVYYVNLHQNNRTYRKCAHSLVARAFLGKPPADRPFIDFKNDNRMDIASDNLQYISGKEKYKDTKANPWNITPAETVEHIKRLSETMRQCEIVKQLGMKKQTISLIVRGLRCQKAYRPNQHVSVQDSISPMPGA
jgi:hypothetical protein